MPQDRFAWREVFVQNLHEQGGRPMATGLRVAIAFAFGFGMIWSTIHETATISQTAKSETVAGSNVWRIIPAEGGGPIESSLCDSLNTLDYVQSAGGVLAGQNVTAANQPATNYPLTTVTKGYLSVMWPHTVRISATPGAYVGRQVAENLGLTRDSVISIRGKDGVSQLIPVADVLPRSPRDDGLDRQIFVIEIPTGSVGECFVESTPAAAHAFPGAISSLFGDAIQVIPYMSQQAPGQSPDEALQSRTSRLGPIVTGGALVSIVALSWYFQRSDLALYVILGMTRAQGIAFAVFDTVLPVLVPLSMGAVLATMISLNRIDEVSASSALNDFLRLVLVILISPVLIIGISRRRNALANLRKG